jgi:Protein of unknown function (DUF4242)
MTSMSRYVVERDFPQGLHVPLDAAGAQQVATVVDTNREHAVTWIHSYVKADCTKTFCVYDGPSPEAIRRVAERNHLPVTAITEVRVLDPYFYLGLNGGHHDS